MTEKVLLVPKGPTFPPQGYLSVYIQWRPYNPYREETSLCYVILDSMTASTHISGHTLDLLITREHDPVICSAHVADRYLSDHASVLCPLNSPKPGHVVKEIS